MLTPALPATAVASAESISAQLATQFVPDKLGASTTIEFTLTIAGPRGTAPPPLTELDFRLPAGMSLIESQLGLATCSEKTLLEKGSSACPADSRMGSGQTAVKFTFGPTIQEARATLNAFLGEVPGPGLSVLIDAEVFDPVSAVFVFPSRLTNDSGLFGVQLHVPLPIIPTLPEAPPLALTSIKVTFGPKGLTYYREEHGRTIAFHPHGLSIPKRCPRGGFPFDADLSFLGGSHAIAVSRVHCPRTAKRHARRHGRNHRAKRGAR